MTQFRLAMQVIENLEGLRSDMRNNATNYINIANAIDGSGSGITLNELQTVIKNDANEYIKRLQWCAAVYNDTARHSDLIAGLNAVGIATADAINDYTTLLNFAQAQSNGSFTTTTEIRTAANSLLSNLTPHDSLW